MTAKTGLDKLKYKLNLLVIASMCSFLLAPCLLFYLNGNGKIIYLAIFIAITYMISLLPKKFYKKIQFSQDTDFYRKLGVKKFKKFSTNGDYINQLIKKSYPTYRNLVNIESIENKFEETYTIERSHTVLFVFCFLTSIHAFMVNSTSLAILIFISNIIFNFYPNLLQQYNRIRYLKVIKNYSRV